MLQKTLKTLLASVLLAAGLTVGVSIATTAPASASVSSNGYWLPAGPHKPGSHATWVGTFTESGRQTVCSDPYLPYASVGLGTSKGALPNLIPGGSAALKTVINHYMSSVNTKTEGAAIAFTAMRFSADKRVRADLGFYRNRLPKAVVSLSDKMYAYGVRYHGPFKVSGISFARSSSTSPSATASATLKASSGAAIAGVKPKVVCGNATVWGVTGTNGKGVATFKTKAKKTGAVTCTMTFGGLPSWTTTLTGHSAGHQHQSTGHYNVSVSTHGSFTYYGTASVSVVNQCTSKCGLTVPVGVTANNTKGGATLYVALVDKATGKLLGSFNVGKGGKVTKTINVANGDGKSVYAEYYFTVSGKRVSSVFKSGVLLIVCPPAPSIETTIKCDCSGGTASSSVLVPAGARETYMVQFFRNGTASAAVKLTNGTTLTHPWSSLKKGDDLMTVVTAKDAKGVTHQWMQDIEVKATGSSAASTDRIQAVK